MSYQSLYCPEETSVLSLGGIIQDQLMTRSTIMQIPQLGDIESQRGQLCGLLNQNLASTVNLLGQPIQNMSITLEQLHKGEINKS
jgi:hypothetical protein